jgi:hypothetical protein
MNELGFQNYPSAMAVPPRGDGSLLTLSFHSPASKRRNPFVNQVGWFGKICLNKPRPNEKRHEPAGRAGRVECLNCGRVFAPLMSAASVFVLNASASRNPVWRNIEYGFKTKT